MGKKSREKKERRQNASGGFVKESGFSIGGMLSDPKFQTEDGGVLMVIDGHGQAMGYEDVRKSYWADVCEAIRGDEPALLPAMDHLGRLMNLSIFDVRVPMIAIGSDKDDDELDEIILLALFQMDYVECFRWLYKAMLENASTLSDEADESMSTILGVIFLSSATIASGSPKERMAKIAARAIIEGNYKREGELGTEGAMCSIPIFKEEMNAFAAELAAIAERSALELEVAESEHVDLAVAEPLASSLEEPGGVHGLGRGEAIRL